MLEEKVFEYVEITSSEEYKKAKILVDSMRMKCETIKRDFKSEGITELEIERKKGRAILKFNIGKMNRVDVSSLPNEIREAYMKESDVWREFKHYKSK